VVSFFISAAEERRMVYGGRLPLSLFILAMPSFPFFSVFPDFLSFLELQIALRNFFTSRVFLPIFP